MAETMSCAASGPFGSWQHRTMAEVAETDGLLVLKRSCGGMAEFRRLFPRDYERLHQLLKRAAPFRHPMPHQFGGRGAGNQSKELTK